MSGPVRLRVLRWTPLATSAQRRVGLRGFTLVEVLIAVAIVAVIAVLGYRALAALSDSESRLSVEAARWRALDGFFARLEGDLREAVPRVVRIDATQEPAWYGVVDSSGNATLSFSRAGPEFNIEPSSAGQRLTYRFRDGNVEILYWGGYDRPRASDPTVYTLLSDVSVFHLSYLQQNNTWVDRWPATAAAGATINMPRGVRVSLTLANGEVLDRWLALR